MLGEDQGSVSLLAEPNADTFRHSYGSGGLLGLFPRDWVGLLYTCADGFVDLGHVRDMGDLTKFYVDALAEKNRRGEVISPPRDEIRGTVTLVRDVPPAARVDVARSLAYDEGLYHEIESFWKPVEWGEGSSFSPEDLLSNLVGTAIAAATIRDTGGGDYDTRFAQHLKAQVTRLGVVDRATTKAALERIEGTWTKEFTFLSRYYLQRSYLQRRSFAWSPPRPWLVDGLARCRPSAGPQAKPATSGLAIPLSVASYYTVDYYVPLQLRFASRMDASQVSTAELGAQVEKVRAAATQKYGPDFESPAPVGHIVS